MDRIVFMGTPDFAVPALEALIEIGNVVGVVTQPDRPAGRGNRLRQPPVKVAALSAEIPVFQPKSLRKYEAAAPIREWEPDLIVVAAFGQILKPHLLDYPRLGCVNIHASLLPRWRGAAPIQAAILHGDGETGITLMQMDEGLDTGDMLVTESIPIGPTETASGLHDRLAELGREMMRRHLSSLLAQSFEPVPQDDTHTTYAPRIQKNDGLLDWSTSIEVIDRQIRALTPWPGTFTHWQGKQIKIHAAQPMPADAVPDQAHAPGSVMLHDSGEIVVLAERGALRLDLIQLEGKKKLSAADFVRGRPDFVGAHLGEFKEKKS